jgi:hypothetical protein
MRQRNSSRHRVQFDFAPGALARVDKLVEITEAPTRADVVRNALRVYEWLVDKALQGKSIIIVGNRAREGPIDLRLITSATTATTRRARTTTPGSTSPSRRQEPAG